MSCKSSWDKLVELSQSFSEANFRACLESNVQCWNLWNGTLDRSFQIFGPVSVSLWKMSGAASMQVLSCGTMDQLYRPCVDCGRWTGCYCDGCTAASRGLQDVAPNQMTPLCNTCDNKQGYCHFCLGLQWCGPQPWGRWVRQLSWINYHCLSTFVACQKNVFQ